MQTASRSELPSMLATLCSYENCFGPYHPQTLRLTTTVAVAHGQLGEFDTAARLLERVLRDAQRMAGRDSELRLRAIAALRDLWLQREDAGRAASVQREFVACSVAVLGPEHPDTLAAQRDLATLLFSEAA